MRRCGVPPTTRRWHLVRLRLPARQSARAARRAVAAQRGLPQLVQGAPRHAHARHSRQRARRREPPCSTGPASDATGRILACRPAASSIVRAPLRFEFDGGAYEGYAGDTLASALLANGVHLVGRSFKYHRPRGIFSAGAEEPNALVQLARGARTEPNVRATTLELHDGLVAASQNCWPSVRFDVGAINDALSRLLPRRLLLQDLHVAADAEVVAALRAPDPARRRHGPRRARARSRPLRTSVRALRCAGHRRRPAGLAAARAAAHAGARVIVCDERAGWGGALARTPDATIDGRAAADWMRERGALAAQPNVTRAAAHDRVRLLRRQSCRRHRARHRPSVVAAAARAAPAPVADTRAVGDPCHRRASSAASPTPATTCRARCSPARRANTSSASACGREPARSSSPTTTARTRLRSICSSPASRSPRSSTRGPAAALDGALPSRARAAGLAIVAGSAIVAAHGRLHVSGVDVAPLAGGPAQRVACDLVCVSGGCNPAVHLFSQARGKLRYDEALASFVPDSSPLPIAAVGAANGRFGLAAALAEGHLRRIFGGVAHRPAPRARSPRRRPRPWIGRRLRRSGQCRRAASRRSASSICRTTSP